MPSQPSLIFVGKARCLLYSGVHSGKLSHKHSTRVERTAKDKNKLIPKITTVKSFMTQYPCKMPKQILMAFCAPVSDEKASLH
jgi:hypothetical protein